MRIATRSTATAFGSGDVDPRTRMLLEAPIVPTIPRLAVPRGCFSIGLVRYVASQGAGRLFWPVMGNLVRFLVAGRGGWLALRWGGQLIHVFVMQGVAMRVYGIVIVSAIAGGAWFGPVDRPRTTASLMRRLQYTTATYPDSGGATDFLPRRSR